MATAGRHGCGTAGLGAVREHETFKTRNVRPCFCWTEVNPIGTTEITKIHVFELFASASRVRADIGLLGCSSDTATRLGTVGAHPGQMLAFPGTPPGQFGTTGVDIRLATPANLWKVLGGRSQRDCRTGGAVLFRVAPIKVITASLGAGVQHEIIHPNVRSVTLRGIAFAITGVCKPTTGERIQRLWGRSPGRSHRGDTLFRVCVELVSSLARSALSGRVKVADALAVRAVTTPTSSLIAVDLAIHAGKIGGNSFYNHVGLSCSRTNVVSNVASLAVTPCVTRSADANVGRASLGGLNLKMAATTAFLTSCGALVGLVGIGAAERSSSIALLAVSTVVARAARPARVPRETRQALCARHG